MGPPGPARPATSTRPPPADSQPPDPLSRGRINRIAPSRRRAGRPRLPHTAGTFLAIDQVGLDTRRLGNAHGAKVVEITLLHPARGESDLVEQRRAQPEHHSALHLR